MRKVSLEPKALDDIEYWLSEDRRILAKVLGLIKDIRRDPFSGLGKPEPLRGDLAGAWSRRITEEHRIVYKITGDEVAIASCRFHYR
ncbi:MAG: Txe/YoeB family addiction module toxin [Pyrinomonadaceae bacterium]|nr:Txe/YoeB family addiction module toxin [Pyrinomonadaceae bacterium]